MLRPFLRAKIHRAKVTRRDLDYVGSITIDRTLLAAAELLPLEEVEVYNVTRGTRFATYCIPGEPGSGEVGVNGAAAHLVTKGDLVILAAYGYLTEAEAQHHEPKVVFVDERNRITSKEHQERNPAVTDAFA